VSKTKSSEPESSALTGRIMALMLTGLLVANLGAIGWTRRSQMHFQERANDRMAQVEEDIAVMQSNRFTAGDGKEVYARIADLSSAIAALQSLNERLGRIESRLDALFEKLMASRNAPALDF